MRAVSSSSRRSRRSLVQAALLMGVFCAIASIPHGVRAGANVDKPEPDPAIAAAARHVYSEEQAAKYDFRYGKESPFLPSNARTDTGEFISPKSFPTAQYCSHCHQETHTQWRESAHSNSNRAPWYLTNVGLLNTEKGIEFSRHCEGCHDPIALVAGALTKGAPKKRPYDQDGVTCMVCHSIQQVDTRGTGSYVMGVPAVLVDAAGQPITRQVSDAEILMHLDRHSKAVMRPLYQTAEFCAACHKAALPQTLNGYKWQRAISLYDEWQNSSFAKQSPLPFYKKDVVSTCQTCHMQRESLRLIDGTVVKDFGAKNGKLASHRWLGANTMVPKQYGFDEQAARIVAFLKNNVFNVDLFAVEHADGTKQAPVGLVPVTLKAGERITADVVIQNKGIAHSHVPEQRDMYESWVKFTVKDGSGGTLYESGGLAPNGDLDPEAHSFTNRLINVKGTLNDHHQVWNNRVVAYNNTIQSGRSQLVRYSFPVPAAAKGPLTLTASVQYRRFDQHFIDFGLNKQHYVQPIVEMVSATRTLGICDNPPDTKPAAGTPPDPAVNPEWMRWNNYGIALLDGQQYAASVAAFQRVVTMRPDYADAYTNVAIAMIAWEKYSDARPNLQKSLTLDPGNARALYYEALVDRNEGNLDAAIVDLQKVVAKFPRSRDAHRELGFSFYQQHRYPEARAEYETMQTIDPDDLAAHYNLAILYRRMGLKKEAAEQAAMFADQKDDPTASTYALEYLRGHTEVANESIVWHAHELDHAAGAKVVGSLPATFSNSQ